MQDSRGLWYKIPLDKRSQIEQYFQNIIEKNDNNYYDSSFDQYICLHPCNYMFKNVEVLKESNQLTNNK